MLNVECSLLNHQIGTRDINHLWLTPGRLVATCIIYSFSLRRHRRGYFTISYLLVVAMVGAVLQAQTCKRFLAMLKCIVHFSEKAYKYFTGCPAKLFPLGYLLFCRLLLMQIAKVGSFMKNSGNLLQDRHKNFEN